MPEKCKNNVTIITCTKNFFNGLLITNRSEKTPSKKIDKKKII